MASSLASTTDSCEGNFTPTSSQDGSQAESSRNYHRSSSTGAQVTPTKLSSPRQNMQSLGHSESSTPLYIPSTYASLHTATPSPRRIIVPVSRKKDSSSGSPTASTTFVDRDDFGNSRKEVPPLSSSPLGGGSTRDTSETPPKTPEIEADESESERSSDADDELYDVRQESLPSAPIYDQRLQTGLKDVKSHLADLVHAMGASGLAHDPNSSLHKLRSDTKKISEFQYPERRTVGFIGDSGVGMLRISLFTSER
jgi:hypothetical protein